MDILISVGRNADPANYIAAVTRAGGNPIAAYLPEPDPRFDALILAGGGDIEPTLFGQKNCGSDQIDYLRDRRELALTDAFAAAGKPILGICRGHQLINVWTGGGLIQDLSEQNAVHRRIRADKVHPAFACGGALEALYGGCFRVNSAHHQAVGPVGAGLRVTARSADGIIEAMEHTQLPILTVQFHPERMNAPDTADGGLLLRWFLRSACK